MICIVFKIIYQNIVTKTAKDKNVLWENFSVIPFSVFLCKNNELLILKNMKINKFS